ncbi:MAG: methanol dehydrogenase [Saprospirales bacterium]|nr:methanol dehydrogenase [Saprospirales bacterium]
MKQLLSKYLLLPAFLLMAAVALAKEPPDPPQPPRLVNDYTNILSQNEVNALERKLVAYDDSTSTQIAIVIEPSLEGDDIFDYSFRLAEKWGIGRAGKDNGILIYIALQDRKLYIQTGYGAEGFLPDAMAKRIIDQVIVPNFRQQRYYEGLNRATDIIMKLGSGEYTNDDLAEGDDFPIAALVVVILFILIIIAISAAAGGGGYYKGGRYDSGGGWMIFGPGGWDDDDDDDDRPRKRRRRGGGWGGWDSGGGFGGGGFGGFGGGGFGGGGAGGSW